MDVPEGCHYNDKVGKGVPLSKPLDKKVSEAIEKSYVAHHHTRMGRKKAAESHHTASAAHYEAAHHLKEAGFSKLAKHHLSLSHHHRRSALGY